MPHPYASRRHCGSKAYVRLMRDAFTARRWATTNSARQYQCAFFGAARQVARRCRKVRKVARERGGEEGVDPPEDVVIADRTLQAAHPRPALGDTHVVGANERIGYALYVVGIHEQGAAPKLRGRPGE